MKTFLVLLTIVAAFTAFALVPFALEITASALFAAGFAGLMFSDYTRAVRQVRLPTAPALAATGRSERFGLAA
jgi:hypothetical protein